MCPLIRKKERKKNSQTLSFIQSSRCPLIVINKNSKTKMTTTNNEIDFDISQLDDTLISDNQKQTLIDYINQIKNQKHSINDEFNQFKLSTGSIKNTILFI